MDTEKTIDSQLRARKMQVLPIYPQQVLSNKIVLSTIDCGVSTQYDVMIVRGEAMSSPKKSDLQCRILRVVGVVAREALKEKRQRTFPKRDHAPTGKFSMKEECIVYNIYAIM